MAFQYRFPRPAVTLDLVAFALTASGPRVLLIQRARDPFAGRWALPGGFLDMDEDLETGARRELMEETRLEVGALWQIGAFGAVDRDPRGRTVSVAFLAVHGGDPPAATAGDDAAEARWRPANRLPRLAFDHRDVVRAARERLAERAHEPARLATLLPPHFTLRDLQLLHEFAAADGTDSPTFARRARSILKPTASRRGRATLFALSRSRP